MMNCYRAYGFSVASSVELPCPERVFDAPEVTITTGPASEIGTRDEGFLRMTPQHCHFAIPGVAGYRIEKGCRIQVESHAEGIEKDILLYLMGSAFGFLMMQRGEFPTHGSVVAYEGQGILIMGRSGSGKSSLAAAFMQAGAGIVTDDVARWQLNDEGCWILPGYPGQKIWKDTAEQLGLGYNPSSTVRNRGEKYQIPAVEGFAEKPVRITKIIELEQDEAQSTTYQRLGMAQGLSALIAHTYRSEFLSFKEYQSRHFRQMARIAAQLPVYRLTRPAQGFTVAEQVQRIMEELKGGAASGR